MLYWFILSLSLQFYTKGMLSAFLGKINNNTKKIIFYLDDVCQSGDEVLHKFIGKLYIIVCANFPAIKYN